MLVSFSWGEGQSTNLGGGATAPSLPDGYVPKFMAYRYSFPFTEAYMFVADSLSSLFSCGKCPRPSADAIIAFSRQQTDEKKICR